MKIIILTFLSVLCFNALATECPDLSGTYLQKSSSCRGDFKSNLGWPLQELETVVTIAQDKCNSIKISYPNTRYSNAPIEVEKLDLSKAVNLAVSTTTIKAKFFEPSSRATYFGTIKASLTYKVEFEKVGTSLNILSSTLMRGFINYVIPVLDKDSFNCHLEKI